MSQPSQRPDADGHRPDVRSVAKRYHRAERAAGWLVALTAVVTFLVSLALHGLVPGIAVAAALVVALRAPVLRRGGTTRLRTDASPDAVTESFASTRPPVLALQWAVADEVRPASNGAGGVYEHEWLLGLRTHSLTVDAETEASADFDPAARVTIEGTLDGRQWGAYAAAIREADEGTAGRTVVDVELRPRRRFGLRSLPQALIAERYYADAMAAQGYEIVSRDVSFAVSPSAPRS